MIDMLTVAAIAMLLDIVTGVAAAAKTSSIKSVKMREGLWHKAGFVGLLAISWLIEFAAYRIPAEGVDIPMVIDLCRFIDTLPLIVATCVFVLITEIISIMENLCVLNPKIANSPVAKILDDVNKKEV